MKKIRIFPLILVLCLFLGVLVPPTYALDEPPLQTAKAVLLVDLNSGRILYERNRDEQRAPASLTKIMTALLAVEALENGTATLEEVVTAQSDCLYGLDEDSSNADIQVGEQISYKDLLYLAMVHSANEACNILASRIAGSQSAFVAMMNERAASLGCTNTHFVNCNGLPAEGHVSSAYDLYLITAEALRHPIFADVCTTTYFEMPATNLSQARSFYNSNALMTDQADYGAGYVYTGAAGVKTGYTRAAGYCLISTVERDGVRLLAVVLGCDGVLNSNMDSYGNFEDSIRLYDWAYSNFSYREVVNASQSVLRSPVELAADGDFVTLRPAESISLLLPNDTDSAAVSLVPHVAEEQLVAPIAAGSSLGYADIMIDGVNYGSVQLVSTSAVELARGEFIRQRIHETLGKTWVKLLIIFVVLILAGYIALVVRYRRMRREYLRKKRAAERRRAERERYYAQHPQPQTQRMNRYDGETGKPINND